nr:TraM recognition domain-containing protein [Pseudonocardia sp. ICBG1293]
MATAAASNSLDPLIGADGSRWMFWAVLAAITLPLLGSIVAASSWIAHRTAGPGRARAAMTGRSDTRDMRGRGARARAVQLRPTLGDPKQLDPRDLGMCLGRSLTGFGAGRLLYGSEEDVFLMLAGPRSNKTSAVVVPAILSAPGPVVASSNKVDIYILTIGLRARLGRVFVADPEKMTGAPQDWWWNPLNGITDVTDAATMLTPFTQLIGAGGETRGDPFFSQGAARLLALQTLAATCIPSDGSLRDVRRWLAQQSTEPVTLLENNGHADAALGLQGLLEAPVETRGGLFETALTALGALESEPIAQMITPPSTWKNPPRHDVVEFDPWRFLVGYTHDNNGRPVPRDTFYLLTRASSSNGAPGTTALVDTLLRTAVAAATAQGGRLDPPLRAVLDEAANTCPLPRLPDDYSFFGSMSIQVMTFLQSFKQGAARWGETGMAKLWSAATIRLTGAGVQDPDLARTISDLIGPVEVPTYTHQRGRSGTSTSSSTRDKPIMTVADIAALDKRHAILISAGRRPVLIELMPWYRERDADDISAYAKQATAQVRDAAVAALGPDNPLAQNLTTDADNPEASAEPRSPVTSPGSSDDPSGEAASVLAQLDELRRKIAGLEELHRLACRSTHGSAPSTHESKTSAPASTSSKTHRYRTAAPTTSGPAGPEPPGSDTAAAAGTPGTAVDIAALVSWVRDHVAQLIEKKIPQKPRPGAMVPVVVAPRRGDRPIRCPAPLLARRHLWGRERAGRLLRPSRPPTRGPHQRRRPVRRLPRRRPRPRGPRRPPRPCRPRPGLLPRTCPRPGTGPPRHGYQTRLTPDRLNAAGTVAARNKAREQNSGEMGSTRRDHQRRHGHATHVSPARHRDRHPQQRPHGATGRGLRSPRGGPHAAGRRFRSRSGQQRRPDRRCGHRDGGPRAGTSDRGRDRDAGIHPAQLCQHHRR